MRTPWVLATVVSSVAADHTGLPGWTAVAAPIFVVTLAKGSEWFARRKSRRMRAAAMSARANGDLSNADLLDAEADSFE